MYCFSKDFDALVFYFSKYVYMVEWEKVLKGRN